MEDWKNQWSPKIEALAGQHITGFAQQLIDMAKARNKKVVGSFDDIDLVVDPESNVSVDDLVQHFRKEQKERDEQYERSPEGIKLAKEREERTQEKQEKASQLIEKLKGINFSDYETVLEWLCNFQEASDHIGVSFDKNQIISIFKDHGFDIGVNMKKAFDRDDAENFAKYIIKQAVEGIDEGGSPQKVVHKFTNDWKRKFGKRKQSDAKRIEELKKGL